VTVAETMSSPVTTVNPTASIHDAAARIRSERVKRLPVVESGELRGIITTTDLAVFLPSYRLERT